METRPALQHSCRNQRYNYYEKSKGQYITADIRNMADEEEQPSVEEVAQQQPEENVALEVKVENSSLPTARGMKENML